LAIFRSIVPTLASVRAARNRFGLGFFFFATVISPWRA